MQRRKHRVVVEITMDFPCTAKYAAGVVDDILNSGTWVNVTKIPRTKVFDRVLSAELRSGREDHGEIRCKTKISP